MNLKETVIRQLNHSETAQVPYTLGFQYESRQRLDAYYGSNEWQNRIKKYIKPVWTMDCQQKQPIDENYSIDIYGSIWKENEHISHLEKPALAEPLLERISLPKASDFFIRDERVNAAHTLDEFAGSFTLIHIPWGIFEKSWSLRGFENALADMSLNEKFYEGLAERITDHLMEFVEIAIGYDVDGIMFGDDWGGQTGLFMGKERWRRFFKGNYRRLYDRVHQSGKFVLNHCCGNIVDILPDLIEIGLDVYESFQPEVMDIYKVKNEFGADITFWGGLGAQSVIPFGSPDDIFNEISRLRRGMGKGGGFILGPSKDPPSETPMENLIALLEAIVGEE